ncbi:SCP-like extracellular protein [Pseudomassariella vexata]|uniref:SCP-like extracellular protein n=1 Tax=Pseudomassariella vexata TaxID=1141098 RepID=A0A1Y2D9A3_9PEZI|nr:SCP-like extracellular protein [Pseudomassariella vexata]ORY55850.1 SCP-like extracellular protein [Pseudomassariella vexata]
MLKSTQSVTPNSFHSSIVIIFLLIPLITAQSTTIIITVGPTIPTAAPEFTNERTFTSAILNSTNFYRTKHNASSVRWNSTLVDFALSYLDSTCDFAHSGGPYGENLALGCSNATSCVEAWGNERDEYDFGNPDFSEATGHFTQLVWKTTTDVGCSARICGDAGWYLVCEYWPRGNIIGEFREEVGDDVNESTMVRMNVYAVVAAMLVTCFLL